MLRAILRIAVIFILLLVILALTHQDRELRTEISIDAPPETVWRVLTATAAYPEWNPFLVRVQGGLAAGEKLAITARPPGESEMSFTPTVLAVLPNRELAWRGDLPIPGLFTGEHRFLLEPAAGGHTRLVQSEKFTGLLIGPLTRSMLDHTGAGFAEMNLAVKIQSESRQ
ncbi:MAG TPA: SRPBCC domain-containing protein [Paludibaculum sp.]|jgi:hypothetical protein